MQLSEDNLITNHALTYFTRPLLYNPQSKQNCTHTRQILCSEPSQRIVNLMSVESGGNTAFIEVVKVEKFLNQEISGHYNM
jgi:hypothetical protein